LDTSAPATPLLGRKILQASGASRREMATHDRRKMDTCFQIGIANLDLLLPPSRDFRWNQYIEFVMAGLVPAIHVLFDTATKKTWMPGT
jgi:hypothetical protein